MNRALPVGLFCCSLAAFGAPKRLVVVDLHSPPSMMGLAAQVTQAVMGAAKDQGYAVVGPEDLRRQLGEQGYQELLACEGKAACVTGIVGRLGAQRGVTGALNRDERNYLVKLELLNLPEGTLASSIDRPVLIASRRLVQDVAAAVPGFLRGEKEAEGTLTVTASVPDAQVTIDGMPRGTAPVTVQLKPGKHEVRVEKNLHLTVRKLVTVEANQTTKEEVRLLLRPGVHMGDRPERVEASTGDEGGLPTGTWVAAGVAVAAGGTAAVLGSMAGAAEQRLRSTYDPARDVYGGTRQDALRIQGQMRAANIALGVAGAATLTAVVIALVSPGAPPPPVAVSTDGRSVGVTAGGAF